MHFFQIVDRKTNRSNNNKLINILFTVGPLDKSGMQGALFYYSTETCVGGDDLRHQVSSDAVQKRIAFLPPFCFCFLPPLLWTVSNLSHRRVAMGKMSGNRDRIPLPSIPRPLIPSVTTVALGREAK